MDRIEDLLLDLGPGRTDGYGPRPIPDPIDDEVRQLLGSLDGPAREGAAIRSLMSEHHKLVLVAFADRMASLAVRMRDPRFVREGLKALAHGSWLTDPRDAITILSLLYDGLVKLGEDPERCFGEVAGLGEPDFDSNLRAFPDRPEEDRSIEAMGYVESEDEGGFRYARTW